MTPEEIHRTHAHCEPQTHATQRSTGNPPYTGLLGTAGADATVLDTWRGQVLRAGGRGGLAGGGLP
eukprot:15174044-Alexandrium_andersonii.AAC.1